METLGAAEAGRPTVYTDCTDAPCHKWDAVTHNSVPVWDVRYKKNKNGGLRVNELYSMLEYLESLYQ